MRGSRLSLEILGSVVIAALSAPARAQPAGEEFQINTYTTSNQQTRRRSLFYGSDNTIATDASGNFVVVWASEGQDGDEGGIFAQRYESNGTPRGEEFQVNSYVTGNQSGPSVASAANGGFVVIWQSYLQDGDDEGVFGRRYDDNGLPLGSEFQVNTGTVNDQRVPSVASDAVGNFVVVWEGSKRGVR